MQVEAAPEGDRTMERRYYVTDGVMAETVSECQADYFGEALLSGMGAVDVHRPDGSVDSIAGTRYLDSQHQHLLRAQELGDRTLEIIYMGATLRTYAPEQWVRWEEHRPHIL